MILAKNETAAKWLQKQFSTRKVKKAYLAVVSGNLSHQSAIIDLPIRRNPKNPQSFKVDAGGKQAITEYSVLESNNNLSLIELKPTTGRTHQLRVHLSHLGHPIVGDSLYRGLPADRLYLLAKKLEITLPSKERKTFEVDTPNEFKIIMSHE
jgi:RluA family pseudouridine synthase